MLWSDVRFPGKWTGLFDAADYDQVYVLDVEAGADNVRGVRVDGPTVPIFTSPAEDTTIEPTEPLTLHWKAGSADVTSLGINPQGTSSGPIDDIGSYTIPPHTLVRNPSGYHAIALSRMNTVTPAGAVAGSEMRVNTGAFVHVCDRPGTGLCSP